MAPDYDHLVLMQKVEVFEYALETTTGDDLAKILWYKSPSSEVIDETHLWYSAHIMIWGPVHDSGALPCGQRMIDPGKNLPISSAGYHAKKLMMPYVIFISCHKVKNALGYFCGCSTVLSLNFMQCCCSDFSGNVTKACSTWGWNWTRLRTWVQFCGTWTWTKRTWIHTCHLWTGTSSELWKKK